MENEKKEDIIPVEEPHEITITKRKMSLMEKAKNTFVMEDISTVWMETKDSVIIPGIRRVIASTLHAIINGIFSGTPADTVNNGPSQEDRRFISYNDMYGKRNVQKKQSEYAGTERIRKDISSYKFRNQFEAEETIEWMRRTLRNSRDGYLTVAEWYDHFKIRAEWTDNDWGWRDLTGARAMPNTRAEDGWYILVPRPENIRNY